MKHRVGCFVVSSLVVGAGVARAEEETAPAPDATHSPGFMTIERADATSRVGGEVSYLFFKSNGLVNSSATVLRFEPHGQYVDPHTGFGGYAQIPITYASGNGSSSTGIGDAEVGAIFVPRFADPDTGVVFHAGLTLPTGSSGVDDSIANLFGGVSRINDLYLAIPEGLSFRGGVSPMIRQGALFARADISIDANLKSKNSNSTDTFVRINAGVGLDLGTVAVTAETTNIYTTKSSIMGSTGSSWVNTGAIAARMHAGNVQPYAALVLPIDKDSNDLMSAALTVGVEAPI
jgi:hypothetical protein